MNLEDMGPFAAVEGGVFLLYELVEAIIMYTVKPDSSGAVCGMILLATAVMLNLFIGIGYPVINVDMLLRFGLTRKNALLGTLCTSTLNMAASMALAALLGWVDGFIAQAWMDALPWVTQVDAVTVPVWAYFAIGLGVVGLAFGMGSLLQWFGRKAFWILWAAWMLLVVGFNLVDLHAVLELPAIVPTIIGACVIGLVGGCALTLRTSVRN